MLIANHQVLVTFKRADFELKEEVDNIIKLLETHGDLVDVNFDYFPHFIVPTYVLP